MSSNADRGHPTLRGRVAVASGVGVAAGTIAAVRTQIDLASILKDFGYFWAAGRVLLEGGSPYQSLYVYPLPAAVAAAPFAMLPAHWAVVLFVGLSMALCAFALTREGYQRLPILMSFPALTAMSTGQWSPLVLCAALGSGWGWVAALKPTLGAAMLARRLDWRGACWAAGFAALTLLIDPTWPLKWFRAMQDFAGVRLHHIPVMVPGGFLLLLAAARWRTEDGRLILGMSLVPQSMFFYDQLALGLLARTFRQSLVCALWSYAVMAIAYLLAPKNLETIPQNAEYLSRIITWAYYLPALAFALRRPEQGSVAKDGVVAYPRRN